MNSRDYDFTPSAQYQAYVKAVESSDPETWQSALVMRAGQCGQIPRDVNGSYDTFLLVNVHFYTNGLQQ